jgi:hypothetical protein
VTIIFRPAAVDDLAEAAAWYEMQAARLGEDLIVWRFGRIAFVFENRTIYA